MLEEGGRGTFSNLQHLLQLSYSENPQDQQKAAVNISKLVESTAAFPAVSFGPLAHALCRLVPNSNRTVASASAKALKLLILDDALRSQAIVAGVPAIVCGAIKQWQEEVLCLRELLGALQILCWDKQCIKGVLQADIIMQLIEYTKATDNEVAVLALATLANMLVFADSLLLADGPAIEALGTGMGALMDILRSSQQLRPQRFYAAAAVANASAHPRLADLLNKHGALPCCREIERQSLANLHTFGSRIGDCALTAIYHLSGKREGEAALGQVKYSFKWGAQARMEVTLGSLAQHGQAMCVCVLVWLMVFLYLFGPSIIV